MISAAAFSVAARQPGSEFFSLRISSAENKAKTEEDPAKTVPEEYHDFLPLFSKKEASQLAPHRNVDHEIILEPGTKPPFGPMYSMSDAELKEVREWLDEHLSKSFIRASSSSCASPILFVKKKDGSLRLCVDYRALNAITKKDRYPLPRIDESLHQIQGSTIFTKLDLRHGYNLIRIKEGDEWKTAFRTRYGLYEFLVMPFGLTNAPATFQRYINDTLREFLDVFCVVYLDDILIYSKNTKEHQEQVRKVLEKLQEAGLFVNPGKCEFSVSRTSYLGFIIDQDGISMDQEKIKAITEWEAPRKVRDVQCFLGFANFYRRFIHGYSRVCRPLFDLLQKNHPFEWTSECQEVFDELKMAFTTAPILRHFDPTLETILETDASDFVTSGILSQRFPERDKLVLHPVAFFSKKMSPAECNYGIGDKELLAIVQAFEEWHIYLHGLESPVLVYTDHHNLETFRTKRMLNRRQARWAGELAQYNFKIVFIPGEKNGKADALTRRSGDRPEEGDGRARPVQAVLSPEQFQEMSLSAASMGFDDAIRKAQATDPLAKELVSALQEGSLKHSTIPLAECTYNSDEKLLYVYSLLYVPPDEELQMRIIRSRHDHPAAGHPGRAATFELVTRDFWWPSMRKTIARYVRNCDTCRRIKPARHMPFGYLKPLRIPVRRWSSVSLDYIVGLPESNGFNALLVIVDRLSKIAHFIPCRNESNSADLARLFFNTIFRHHGLPDTIISDRGTTFTSEFTRTLCKLVGIGQKLSTAFHPQTDGQTERVNAIVEQYIRGYCNYQQDNWAELLTMAEFAYNNTISATTGVTPFFANYGYHPRYQIRQRSDSPAPLPETLRDYSERLQGLDAYLRAEISWSQDMQAEQANKNRLPPPVLNVGDYVWLLRRHIQTTRPSSKLDYKRLGKFRISEKISAHAYKLELPPSMKVHPVFHVSLLEPAATDPLPGQVQPPPPPVIVDNEEEFEVEEILDSRRRYRRLEYLVRWVGYDTPTWQPAADCDNCPTLVRKFHDLYPNKPRPQHLPDLETE
ncbi:MAG TPA: reverse transcriptase domain-containing protein [Fimbriimonas sp.]|nr:reverse transcriptase domain-containing protein [Fimbriimonas sp.]